jgi:hypothetical protein
MRNHGQAEEDDKYFVNLNEELGILGARRT